MAHIQSDRVQETTTVTGTGTLTLLGAVANFLTFASRMATSDTCYYAIIDSTNGAWEVGLGTLLSSTTLGRTTVLRSSNSDAAVTFAAGTKSVFITVSGDRNLLLNGELTFDLPAISAEPVAPAASNLKMYSKLVAGRMIPKFMGDDGNDYSLQVHIGRNRVIFLHPTTGAAIGVVGTAAITTSGTLTTPVLASTNLLTSVRTTLFSSGTVAGTVASLRSAQTELWRGNAAGLGGFEFTARFGLNTLVTNMRAFVGITDAIAVPTNVDPTTSVTIGKVGMAININTGNWNIVTNVAGSAPTVTALGANFPVNTTDLLELVLFAAPDGSGIGYRVVNLSTGNNTSGTITTNLPAATTFLTFNAWVTNNATAAAAIMAVNRFYLESDT